MRWQTRMAEKSCYGANVHANGIRQHYLHYSGEGPPLIIVPGITSPAVTWGFVAERIARSFEVFVLDVRGRGLSETGPGLKYDLETYADDLVAFAGALGLTKYAVLGHSMGARIAIRAGRRTPQGLDRIALVDPPVTGPGRRPYPVPLSWYTESIAIAERGAGVEALRAFTPTWPDEHIALRAEWLHTCHPFAIERSYDGFMQEEIVADLSTISIPALLIVAGNGVIQRVDVEEIERIAPQIALTTIEGAGHMIPWDDFEGFFRGFGNFFGAPL